MIFSRGTSKGLLLGLLVLFCCSILPIQGLAKGKNKAEKSAKPVVPPVLETSSEQVVHPNDSSFIVSSDTAFALSDTLSKKDTLVTKKNQTLTEIVDYSAQDSLVFEEGGFGRLYGKSSVTYGDLNLDAGYILMNMDSSMLYATGRLDSLGKEIETPVFKNEGGEYKSKKLKYNFKTKKGLITQVVTQQGEGYVVSGITKKQPDNVMCMINGQYTTCDNHEHPHFYLDLSKAKVNPGHYIVSGPAHLVIEDVDLPLFIPFGYFPFKGDYASGILTPTYGDELSRGFFLKDMGYYFAISDRMDLAITGELYSKGSWGIKARSAYKVRYKYSGSFNFSYIETVNSEKNLPDYYKLKDLSLQWSHSQDSKANPYQTFGASVNFKTSGYAKNDLSTLYNATALSENTKYSSINYSRRFAENPLNITMSMDVSQQSKDSTMSVKFPSLGVSVSKIFPFKRKNASGDERWYEKINFSYTGALSNSISSVKESEFLHKSIIKDWNNSITHSVPISATFSLLNYLNLTTSVSYNERWYSSSVDKTWDATNSKVLVDTTWGFSRVWQYSTSVGFSTKLYGMYQPSKLWEKIFGNKIRQIRHVLTPEVSFSYRPDWGQAKYGYYGSYTKVVDDEETTVVYSRYNGWSPGRGKSGSINFSFDNNLEMKVRHETDTAIVDKKVSLIDDFRFGSAYNMAADSLNFSNISTSIRLKFGSKYTLSLSGELDPYTYILDKNNNVVRTNTTQFEKYGIPGRLVSTGTSFSYTFNNDTFKKVGKMFQKKDASANKEGGAPPENSGSGEGGGPNGEGGDEKKEENPDTPIDPIAELYAPCKIPWSLSVSYTLRYSRSDFNVERLEYDHDFYQNMSLSGNIALTDKWKLTASTSYNFQTKKLATMTCSVSRDLHCWAMTASFIPIGPYKSYSFSIAVKSSLLQDIKYDQHQNPRDNYIW
jgi:hypothetical protein